MVAKSKCGCSNIFIQAAFAMHSMYFVKPVGEWLGIPASPHHKNRRPFRSFGEHDR
jgi:hypothetical protein